MKKEITTAEGLKILGNYVPDIALTVISSLVTVHPVLMVAFLAAKGMYGVWGDYGQARLNEMVVELEKNKKTLDPEVLKTEKFASVFLNTLERHMKESSYERRELLRRYLVSVGQGKNPEFEYHTKLFNILDQITGDELRLFILLPFIAEDSKEEMRSISTKTEQEKLKISERETDMNLFQVKMRLKDWDISDRDLASLLRFLGNYGLIATQDVASGGGFGGGGGSMTHFQGITEVGKAFYDFIDHPSFSKEIIDTYEYRKKFEDSLAINKALEG